MRLYSSYAYTSAFTKIKILVKASICPSGTGGNWVLPLSGTANNNVSGSFYNLLNQYNATSGTTGATTIVQLPLAFVRSGNVDINDGRLYIGGWSTGDGQVAPAHGYGWSRTARLSALAYGLGFNTTGVYPSNYYNRWYGFPLRCLYPGSA